MFIVLTRLKTALRIEILITVCTAVHEKSILRVPDFN